MNDNTFHRASTRTRSALAVLACAMVGSACSATTTADAEEAPATVGTTGPSSAASSAASSTSPPPSSPTSAPSSSQPSSLPTASGDALAAIESTKALSTAWIGFVGSVVNREPDEKLADEIASLHDPAMATFDTDSLTRCVTDRVGEMSDGIYSAWEHASWQDNGATLQDGATPELNVISVLDNLAKGSDGEFDSSTFTQAVVDPNGLVGVFALREDTDEDDTNPEHVGLVNCLTEATKPTPAGEAALGRVRSAKSDSQWELFAVEGYDGQAAYSQLDNVDSSGSGEVTQREGLPADPADPEPIQSTGSNKWDLITTDDPTAFERLAPLGTGKVELLPGDGDGGYTEVDDAYLYRAHFTDETEIEIRIHPDIGTQADADAEVKKYLVPLGQLPTVLRRDIGTLSVVIGERTASASPGEGITVRTENMKIRLGDNRLEETLFHESIHSSLDRTYAQSPEWLGAQEADGRFIAEYARENPDREDLAETALYAFAMTYHPERFPDGVADELRARVPNRLAFIETNIFPVGQPWIEE